MASRELFEKMYLSKDFKPQTIDFNLIAMRSKIAYANNKYSFPCNSLLKFPCGHYFLFRFELQINKEARTENIYWYFFSVLFRGTRVWNFNVRMLLLLKKCENIALFISDGVLINRKKHPCRTSHFIISIQWRADVIKM